MADDKDLAELERDVEQSRARLAADIARLRVPETFESARQSVMDSIAGYRDDAIDAAQTRGFFYWPPEGEGGCKSCGR